jgi:hypothetical protein
MSTLSLCSTYFEELINEHHITDRSEECPFCKLPGHAHLRMPSLVSFSKSNSNSNLNSNSNSSSSVLFDSSLINHTSSINREALKSLPKWKIDYNQSRLFLDRMEQIFFAANLPTQEYTKQLLLSVSDVSEANYIRDNIITPNLKWEEARIVFQNHFDVFNITEQNESEYEKCKKLPRESVQHYSDRYLVLCSALNIKDDDTRAINHFIHGLDDKLKEEYKRMVNLSKILNNNNNDLTSLKKVIAIIISLELSHISSSFQTTSLTQIKTSSSSQSISPYHTKTCTYHPQSRSHTTAQCLQNPSNRNSLTPTRTSNSLSANFSTPVRVINPTTPLPSRLSNTVNSSNYTNNSNNNTAPINNNNNIICNLCKQVGHYANRCPSSIAQRTRSHVALINNNNINSSLSAVNESEIYEYENNHENNYENNMYTSDFVNNINSDRRIPDHLYEKCRREFLCYKCQKPGHTIRNCTLFQSKNELDQHQQ